MNDYDEMKQKIYEKLFLNITVENNLNIFSYFFSEEGGEFLKKSEFFFETDKIKHFANQISSGNNSSTNRKCPIYIFN